MTPEEQRQKDQERNRAWFRKVREENPELYQKRLERSRKWHEENRDEVRRIARETMARERAEHREKYNAYMREFRAKESPQQRELRLANMADYYREHYTQAQEQKRRWAASHAEQERARGANKAAWRRKATGKFTPDDIRALYKRQNGKCAICGHVFPETGRHRFEIDHIIPLKPRGATAPVGTNNPENLQLLCGPCNRSKSNRV